MSIIEQVKLHRKGIRYETITFSLWELVSMHLSDPQEIQIRPDFQRLFRWSREQQSSFVESILLEIPIPPLFFYETESGTWDLLDGLQRISTLIRFMGSKQEVPSQAQGSSGNESNWHYDNENKLEVPLQLIEGEYLTSLKGFTFKSLPTQLQLNFKRSRLHIYVLKRETDSQYKYEIFKRINRGGSVLEEQEVRSCSVRLLDNKFPEFLESISVEENFVNALGLNAEYSRNGYIEELALRFFAMKNKMDEFKHGVKTFLTSYMEEVARGTYEFDYTKERDIFNKTFFLINSVFTDGEAFRGKTKENKSLGPFAPSIFEAVSVGIASNIDKVEKISLANLTNNITDFIKELKNKSLTGSGSNSKSKTFGRINLAIKTFDC